MQVGGGPRYAQWATATVRAVYVQPLPGPSQAGWLTAPGGTLQVELPLYPAGTNHRSPGTPALCSLAASRCT